MIEQKADPIGNRPSQGLMSCALLNYCPTFKSQDTRKLAFQSLRMLWHQHAVSTLQKHIPRRNSVWILVGARPTELVALA